MCSYTTCSTFTYHKWPLPSTHSMCQTMVILLKCVCCVRSGLSRRIIVQDAEARRTQTYSTTSDVLAQQFAVRVSEPVQRAW